MVIQKSILACCIGWVTMIPLCGAHPHNWVTMRSEFVANDAGELVAVNQTWRFDFFFSAILVAETVNEWQQPLPKALEFEARRMIQNLAPYQYFSVLSVNERELQLPAPDHYALQVVKAEGQEFLELTMHFQMTQPTVLAGSTMSWSVYDPTYYIAYSHEHADNVTIRHASNLSCSKQLKLPKLTEELIAYAFSLDQTERDTDGLGRAFAEKILIACERQGESR